MFTEVALINEAETIKIVDKVVITSEVVDHRVKTIAMITIIHNRKDSIIMIEIVVVMVVAVLVAVTMVKSFFLYSTE